MSGFRTKSYKCPGSERNHTNVRVGNCPPCPLVVAASGILVGAAGVALMCHLKAKSGHHLLTKCRKDELVVKFHLKAKCAHPWLSVRRKGDLVVKCHLKAKSGPPSFVKATWSLGVTRPERAAILGLRNVVKKIWS